MKKFIVAVSAIISLLSINNLRAQDLVVGGETGFNLFARNGANFAFPIGANVEWDINGNLSLLGRVSFDIGLGRGDFNIFYFNPEVRYHFSEVFDGAYVGGFLGFGPTSRAGSYVAFGAAGGYQLMLSEHFNLDISVQFGLGNAGASGARVTGIHFRPTVGLRYAF